MLLSGCVYVLIDPRENLFSPKRVRYVGVTTNLNARLDDHWYMKHKRNTHKNNWLKSLERFGESYVTHEIIEYFDCCTRAELFNAEVYWIAQFKAWGFKLTNMTSGGDGVFDLPEKSREALSIATKKRMLLLGDAHQSKTPESRAKASERLKAADHPIRSKEARKKSGDKRKGTRGGEDNVLRDPTIYAKWRASLPTGDNHHAKRPEWRKFFSSLMKGRNLGDKNPAKKPEARAKISANRKGLCTGADHPRSRAVVCLDNGMRFPSAAAAAEWLKSVGKTKATSGNILGVCRGQCKQCYGYVWAFVV